MTFLEIKITCDHPACDRTLSTLPINPDEVLEAVACEVKACHWTAVPSSPVRTLSPTSPSASIGRIYGGPDKHYCPEHSALRSFSEGGSSKLVTP